MVACSGGHTVLQLALLLLLLLNDANGQQELNAANHSDGSSQAAFVDITATLITPGISSQLVASRRTHCPVTCASYEAGASADSPFVAQAVASGVDDLGKYVEKGVVCFPPYNAAPHWNICYQHTDPSAPIPKYSHDEVCQELASGRDWSTSAHGSTASPETTKGRWMSLDADLGCGWGSTITNLLPSAVHAGGWDWLTVHGYASPTVTTYNAASNDYECCLQAMAYEGTPKEQGGSAVRFEYTAVDGKCRVDREAMMLGNLDASSGLAMRDTQTCNSGKAFIRHATGSADASNLISAGRCELQHGFKRLMSTSSASLPGNGFRQNHHFESARGNELPNHACNGGWPYGGCTYVIGYNTINSAEECCQACVELSWIEETGGNVDTDPTTGEHLNPCLAWQITDGICTIMRREYAVYHNVAMASEYFEDQGFKCSGDACNYYSHLRYREAGGAITPVAANSPNATFTRVVTVTVNREENSSMIIRANISGVGSNGGKYGALIAAGDSEAAVEAFATGAASTATAQIIVVEGTSLTQFDDQSTFLDADHLEQGVICRSPEAGKGGWLDFECDLTSGKKQTGGGPVEVAIAFSSIGDGGDEMTFSNVKVLSGPGSGEGEGAAAANAGDTGSTSPAPAHGIGQAWVLAVVAHAFRLCRR